jgi:hypothetical protein
MLGATAAAALVWLLYPRRSVIYHSNNVTVEYAQTWNDLLINVKASSGNYVQFRFDYWQDGLRHKNDFLEPAKTKVEPVYGVDEYGALCSQWGDFDFSADKYALTICGGLATSAEVVSFRQIANITQYTLVIPKKELSSGGESASMVINFYNEFTKNHDSYPPARFAGPIRISFKKGPPDLRELFH